MGKAGPALAVAGQVWRAATAPPARLILALVLIGGVGASVIACGRGGNGEKLGERVIPFGQPVPKGGGAYRVGAPYQVDGVWYRPREDSSYDQVGRASWYGELFHGRRTSNGEIYDMDRLSAASPTLPLPVYARVTNLQNRRSIIVRVNDRGPYRSNRVIDLSRRSAELLGFRGSGTAWVRVQYLGRAPLNGDDSLERRYVANQGWAQVASGSAPQAAPREPVAVRSIAREAMANRSGSGEQGTPDAVTGLRWQARAETPASSVPAQRARPSPSQGGLLVQAGTFRSQDNAERARSRLGDIAQVEVAPVTAGSETYFRVRVGPFPSQGAAAAALARVTEAGYGDAKILRR